MQAKLLAKIEELTLHMIEAEKENHELRERIAKLESASATQRGIEMQPLRTSERPEDKQ